MNGALTVVAFAGVLWTISPLLFGVAVGYAALGSLLAILLGRPLVGLNYRQLDLEADFRSTLIHVRENAEAVQVSLLKIPAYYREVLLLRFSEDLGLQEIAGVTATPVSTVKSRLYRGLAVLKAALMEGAA